MHTLEENINQASADFNRIKDKIVECGVDVPADTSTSDYAAKVGAVYNKAYGEGKEAGQQAEYDEFWDRYQEYGKRNNYSCAFAGSGWTTELFKPKYNIAPNGTVYMLFYRNSTQMDLVDVLEKAGVTLDTSKAGGFEYTFADTGITRLGIIDASTSSSFNGTFGGSAILETIEKLILKSDGSQTYINSPFKNCTSLVNLTIEGVIGKDGLSFQWSHHLSRESITSIIYALSPITTGLSITFSKTAINNAFSGGGVWGVDSAAWTSLVNLRSNWTITLV